MGVLANILMLLALGAIGVGLVLNPGYILSLPSRIPQRVRWAGYLWLIMAAGLATWFGRANAVASLTTIDASAFSQILSIVVSIAVILLLLQKYFTTRNLKAPFVLLLIYALLGMVTAPAFLFPALYLFKATSLAVAVIAAVMATKSLADERQPALLFNIIYVYFTVIATLAIFGGLAYPDRTHLLNEGVFGFMLVGWPALNPNSVSYVSAVVFLVSLHRAFSVAGFRLKILYSGACMVGAIGLLLAQGRTSLGGAAIAVLFLSFFSKPMHSVRYIALAGIVVGGVIFVLLGSLGDWAGVVGEYLRRGASDESLSTLSGRTEAWQTSWLLFLEKPIFGYGFYACGKELFSPHNAAFTVLLNGGALGFIFWFSAIAGGIWAISRRVFDRDWRSATQENGIYLEMVAVLIVQFLRTVTGQDLTIHSYSMLLFLGMLVYVYSRQQMELSGQVSSASASQDEINDKTTAPNNRILRPRQRFAPVKPKLPDTGTPADN